MPGFPGLPSLSLRQLSEAPVARQVFRRLRHEQDQLRAAIGRLEVHLMDVRPRPTRLADAEFSVFSQYGEDGIIQHLVREAKVEHTTFVEIGTGDYSESNTRFLVENDNWRGLAVNGGDDHVRFVASSGLGWRHDVEPVSAFVTRDNVDALISDHGLTGPIGLLSMDVDGVDYWLLDAITVVEPTILVAEYNALFGPDARVTVPYDPAFVNTEAHWSATYFGASLGALVHLATSRGYRFVGCSSNGVNAFFVKDEAAGDLPALTAREGFREGRYLTARNRDGSPARMRGVGDRLRVIADLPLVDVTNGEQRPVAEAVPVWDDAR
ncbi:hypothetical protein [Nocardioides sp. TF02-7]|uniref:hypothetical protein n=1 Tax=Nocardioides sp. TF02-7 TaxID=2917724 RepID=UPI001F0613EB|nr:hypothetical protein [Nocardioides sp. TF02-7]UMG91122.1 hypothetical protein MF408_13025 [Nocardioides sp. TF02-7]